MNYMGGKFRQGPVIVNYINEVIQPDQWYVEPFCGALWVPSRLDHPKMILSDISEALVNLWKFLQANPNFDLPDHVSEEEYTAIKKVRDPKDWRTAYYGYGLSFGARYFATFVKDEKDETRTPRAKTLKDSTNRKRNHVFAKGREVKIFNKSYKDLDIPPNSVVYCDPPYANREKVHDFDDEFNSEEFWDFVRKLVEEEHIVLVTEFEAPDDFSVLHNFGDTTATLSKKRSMTNEILVCHESQRHLWNSAKIKKANNHVGGGVLMKEDYVSMIYDEFDLVIKNVKERADVRSDDQLADLKRIASSLDLVPEQIWSVYFNKHIDAINSYIASVKKDQDLTAQKSYVESQITEAIIHLLLFKAMTLIK